MEFLHPLPDISTTLLFVLFWSALFYIAYFGALVRAARLSQWTWFVGMLLLQVVAFLGYALFAPSDPQGRL